MNAFFSATDNANENNTQFYGVWGKVTDDEPHFAFRYVVGDEKIECDPRMLIDWPTVTKESTTVVKEKVTVGGNVSFLDIEMEGNQSERTLEPVVETIGPVNIKGPFKQVDYPIDWMAQHTARTHTYKAYGKKGQKNTYKNTYSNWKNNHMNYDQTSLWDEGENGYDYAYGSEEYYAYKYGYSEEQTQGAYLESVEDDFFRVESLNEADVSEDVSSFLRKVTKDLVSNYDNVDDFIFHNL